MKRFLKVAFVAAFAVAALCALNVDANASGVEGGPGSQTIVSKLPPCPICGNTGVIQCKDENGEICYICWNCKIIFGFID